MKKRISILAMLALVFSSAQAGDWQTLFDGKSLDGWKGLDFWSVKDGTIFGETTAAKTIDGNTFLIWQGGDVGDFEFTCQVKFGGNNSGVQYRSHVVDADKFVLKGYQADLHPAQNYFGMLYGEKFGKRGIIAQRGQRVVANADGSTRVVKVIGDDKELKAGEWNELRIVAVGNRQLHFVNGQITMDLTENHPDAMAKGALGLQLHRGPPMWVNFKDMKLRHLDGDQAKTVLAAGVKISDATAKPVPKKKTATAGAKKNDTSWLKAGAKPDWIWNAKGNVAKEIWLRHVFEIPADVKSARLYTTCDNNARVWLNGKKIGEVPDWYFPLNLVDAGKHLKKGRNVIAIHAGNAGGAAALVFRAVVETVDGKTIEILSNPAWKAISKKPADGWKKADFADSGWELKLKSLGKLGVGPWSIPNGAKNSSSSPEKTSPLKPEDITAAEGFKVELLYTVPRDEQGSWVSITKDPKGRFYASDQRDKGLYRITVSGAKAEVERVEIEGVSRAQGLEWAFGGLYFHKSGGHLFKLTDSDGDDVLDTKEALPSNENGSEHGNHAVTLTPDGKALFIEGGNMAKMPPEESITRKRVQSWDEDLLLPRQWDARGHARGKLAPGGWVSRFDPQAKTHDIITTGFRNEYDIALNSRGDLFTYDADMEWDMGMPWYRPTRICLIASGADYGWRSGSGKWPTYYEDSLPPVVEIGPGSPTGVVTGVGTKFPAKYQDAIFALDWTFGTIYAIHLEAKGAGYVGKSEPWVYGGPLPVTDAEIGDDGNLYFLTGGRNTQSALYRVSYVGSESVAKVAAPKPVETARQALEKFHGVENADAVAAAWPHLASGDRFIRNAARVAVESQPVGQWADRVFSEKDPQARITAAVALARMGNSSHRADLTAALLALDVKGLTDAQLLGFLRAYALDFIRLGQPTREEHAKIIAQLDPLLPSENSDVNTELIRVLTYLEAPNVVPKTMKLINQRDEPEIPDWSELASRNPSYGTSVQRLLDNYPPVRELNYAFMLRNTRKGWTTETRLQYFTFLNEAAKFSGGASFPGFLANMRTEALGNCSDEERLAVADVTGEDFNPKPDFEIKPPQGPGRVWTIGKANNEVRKRKKGRDFDAGRNLFHAVACAACHRFAGLGGGVGPDLTSVKNKFDDAYLIESILDPSETISDQYSSSTVTLKNGKTHTGLAVENDDDFAIYPADATADPIHVKLADVVKVEQVPVSQMPPGLINTLNADELADLIAYLMSGGDREDKRFKK